MTIDVEKVLALVREVADPRWADPVCSMGDMVTLTLDEMIAFADRVAARERAALAAEPAQPVAWRSWTGQCGYGYWESQTDADMHSDPDYRPVPLYTAPPAPADVPVYPNCPHAHECVDGGRYGKGAYEDLMNNAMGGKPWGECLCGIGDDGKPKYQQPPGDVPRLSDEDKDELAGAYLNASPAKRHLGALIEAVEAEVRRRCGVVG